MRRTFPFGVNAALLLIAFGGCFFSPGEAPPVEPDDSGSGAGPTTTTTGMSTTTAGPGGGGGGASSCDDGSNCGDTMSGCIGCALGGNCADELGACQGDPDCIAFAMCIDPCMDQACIDNCIAQHPTGADLYNTILVCVICDECPITCDGPGSGC